jgi:hypothetical protein
MLAVLFIGKISKRLDVLFLQMKARFVRIGMELILIWRGHTRIKSRWTSIIHDY